MTDAEKKDIKEILEIIVGLELIGVTGAKVMADGKVNTSDLGAVVELLTKFNVLIDAVKGAKDSLGEAKDLDQAELLQIGTKVYEVVKNIKAALVVAE